MPVTNICEAVCRLVFKLFLPVSLIRTFRTLPEMQYLTGQLRRIVNIRPFVSIFSFERKIIKHSKFEELNLVVVFGRKK